MAELNEQEVIQERIAVQHFLGLKSQYASARTEWETKWIQAAASVYGTGNLDKVYEGRAKISSPIMFWKCRAIWSRLNQTLLKRTPYGRLEDKNLRKQNKNYVDIVSKYIFEHQLEVIKFKQAFKMSMQEKTVFGTYIAKIPQVYEVEDFNYDPDGEAEEIVVKDDPYFVPIRIHEFYSDVYKHNINESDACIHSTNVSMEYLRKNKKTTITEQYEEVDKTTGEVVGYSEEKRETGIYKNLELLEGLYDGDNLSVGQRDYLQMMGVNVTSAEAGRDVKDFKRLIKNAERSGYISIDECYGLWPYEGEEQECVCVIAAGKVVIRGPEPVKTRHKNFKRPFIVGRYIAIPNCLYGITPNLMGQNLLQELNASRAQNTDAKTQSIFPMWYQDVSKKIAWNKVWKPNGVIKGFGPKGIEPIMNPYLGRIGIEDSNIIQRDLDQLFGISAVNEGSTDPRLVPNTASGGAQVIAENDIPINDLIDDTLEWEMKPFFEMLYERNLTFKKMSDFLVVWSDADLKKAGFAVEENEGADDIIMKAPTKEGEQPTEVEMKDLVFDVNVKILGQRELSNEMATQAGWNALAVHKQNDPNLTKRIDEAKFYTHLLRSYGIGDDSDDIWLDEEIVMKVNQQNQQSLAQQAEEQKQQVVKDYQAKKGIDLQARQAEIGTETEAALVKQTHEAVVEKTTGQKIQ